MLPYNPKVARFVLWLGFVSLAERVESLEICMLLACHRY